MADLRAVAKQKARKYGLDPNIFVRQIQQESGFQTRVTSPAGAQGVAQIMPATAKSWGVNPNDPVAALDAAAKNMARMVKKHGSYERALRGYNAGEGAIDRSKGFAETNHYVKVILGGRDPGKIGKPSSGAASAATGGGSTTTTIKTPGTSRVEATQTTEFDQAGYDMQAKRALLKGVLAGFSPGKPSLLQSVLPDSADPAAFTRTVDGTRTIKTPGKTITTTTAGGKAAATGGSTKAGSAGIPGLKGKGSGIKELFYDPQGGWDGTTSIGAIGGHSNHVHVAAGQKTVIGLGRLAEKFGLTVRENPHWDKVDPVHTPGSHHYKKEAIDVSGDAAKMAAYTKKVRQIYGLK